MDMKARSKAMREILTRLVDRARGAIEVKVFGDKVILDEGEPGPSSFARFISTPCMHPLQMFRTGLDATFSFRSSPTTFPWTKRFPT